MRALTPLALRCFALSFLLGGCVAMTTDSELKVNVQVLDSLTRYEIAYVLQPGDQIEVFVYRHPEFSRKSVIRSDGFISLPLLGEVKAAYMAPRELATKLTELFSARIKNPEVTVIVENPPEPMVYVLGHVGGPRALPLRKAKTVAQALALAGDATKEGDLFGVSVVRLNKNGLLEAHAVEFEIYSQPEVYMALQNMALVANDLVVVPESYRSQFVRLINDVNTALFPYYQYRILFELSQ